MAAYRSMENAGGKKMTTLPQLARDRSKKAEEEKARQIKLGLESDSCPIETDCIFSILVRLPVRSLQRSMTVCKLWYDMIHIPVFVNDHLHRSEFAILFQTRKSKATDFCVETSVHMNNQQVDRFNETSIHLMEYVDGEAVMSDFNISCLGRVVASCNGLILINYNFWQVNGASGGMVVMNPVTRKSIFIRSGTISYLNKESYGLVYVPSTNQYKVVHLFDDQSGYTNCEIIVVGAKYWKMVDGPSFRLINWFKRRPVSAIGALHWLPQKFQNEYIVSMDTEKEVFKTIELPTSGRVHDRIVELGDFLCFTNHEEVFTIGIWVLKSLCDETWTKLHTVKACYFTNMVPIFGSRSGGQMILTREKDGTVAIYDFRLEGVFNMSKNVPLQQNAIYLPHVNSLVSWSL